MAKKKEQTTYYAPPPLPSPSQSWGMTEQLATLLQTYAQTMAQSRLAVAGARGTAKEKRQELREALKQNLYDVQQSNIERGTLGGSQDIQTRIGARGDFEQALAGVRKEEISGVGQAMLDQQAAQLALTMGQAGVAGQSAAARAEAAADEFLRGTIPGSGGRVAGPGGSPGPMGPGGMPSTTGFREAPSIDNQIQSLAKELRLLPANSPEARHLTAQIERLRKRRNQTAARSGLPELTWKEIWNAGVRTPSPFEIRGVYPTAGAYG